MPPKQKAAKGSLHVLARVVGEGTVIADKRKRSFVIEKEFARGGFGRIYGAHQEGGREYGKVGSLAVKIEPHDNGPLFTEISVFQRILKPEMLQTWMKEKGLTHLGLPAYVSSGLFTYGGEKLRFLVMPRFERSLETYRLEKGGLLEPRVTLDVAKQCAHSLAYMQDQDYVHADLKADNLLLGSRNSFSKCFLVDFGLAKLIKSNVENPDKKKAHNGTALFTSLDAHRGCSPSLRGDLEILAYNVVYWLCGKLPWQRLLDKPDQIFAEKEKFSKSVDRGVGELIGAPLGVHIAKIFKLAYGTAYKGKVDYEAVLNILEAAMSSLKRTSAVGTSTRQKRSSAAVPRTPAVVEPPAKKASLDDAEAPSLAKARKPTVNVSRRALRKPAIAAPKDDSSPSSSKRKSTFAKEDVSSADESEDSTSQSNSSHEIISLDGDDLLSVATDAFPSSLPKKSRVLSSGSAASSAASSSRRTATSSASSKASASKTTASASTLNGDSNLACGKSPATSAKKALGTVIPGVRNMKKVRRSLGAALVKKYMHVKK